MRMIEASLYPVIPYLHVQQHDREVTSMSDYVHTGRRSKIPTEQRTIESRLLFGACYLLFLVGAVFKRLMPWRKSAASGQSSKRESIFTERTIESRLLFGACYLLFLVGAVFKRLMPWRKSAASGQSGIRESIFREASSAASILVGSSFMGL